MALPYSGPFMLLPALKINLAYAVLSPRLRGSWHNHSCYAANPNCIFASLLPIGCFSVRGAPGVHCPTHLPLLWWGFTLPRAGCRAGLGWARLGWEGGREEGERRYSGKALLLSVMWRCAGRKRQGWGGSERERRVGTFSPKKREESAPLSNGAVSAPLPSPLQGWSRARSLWKW